MTNSHTATVEALAAEVRVLMVGSRQVTLSVFRQLDTVALDDLDIFGRVRDPSEDNGHWITVVGRHQRTGTLCRARLCLSPTKDQSRYWVGGEKFVCAAEAKPFLELWDDLERLPLIILAGLR
jgi:hypothetical protein